MKLPKKGSAIRLVGWTGIICLAVIYGASAQTTTSPPAKSGAAGGEDGSSSLGFSIESEMLTYRALESNSEAIACDIAAYLHGAAVDFSHPPAGAVCNVHAEVNNNASVVIAPFDRTTFDDFHTWRVAMEIMRELRESALNYCPETGVLAIGSRGSEAPPTKSNAASPLAFAAATPALAMAQAVLGLFASSASNSAVVGTIQDQALMDGVARQLRSLNVTVLMPTTYVPYSLSSTDSLNSPFLSSLDKLLGMRNCLASREVTVGVMAADKAGIDGLLREIDAYVASLRGVNASKQDGAAAPSVSKPTATGTSASKPGETGSTATTASTSPLGSILAGDGLAQKLGVTSKTDAASDQGPWRHILLLKALESGGTLAKKTSIFGSKIRYSGGSVDTYALFTMTGELECSGNVYEFGGSIPADKFQVELGRYNPDPAKQFIFKRGSCGAVGSQ